MMPPYNAHLKSSTMIPLVLHHVHFSILPHVALETEFLIAVYNTLVFHHCVMV